MPFVPGVTNIGNSCDDCSTVITLPFPVTLYDQTYTSAAAGSNGHLTFGTPYDFFSSTCWPSTQGTYVLAPYWDDQVTFNAGEGIFTTTTGTAPNRVFYVEYRTEDFNDGVPLNYEIALYENGSPPFRYIYNTITADPFGNDSELVVGVKKDNVSFTQYGCDDTGGVNPPVSSGQTLTAAVFPCVTPTPTPTPTGSPCPVGDYTITTGSGTIVPGTTDSGNHADDGITTIALPFPVTFYDQSFTSVNICSNGNLQFTSVNATFTNACLPTATMNGLIAPYWDDLYDVDGASGQGVFTSTSGTAPNRIFNIEFREQFCCSGGPPILDFEVRLHEDTPNFEIIYGGLTGNTGSSATVGGQRDTGSHFTQFECNTGGLIDGLQLSYVYTGGCASPTPTASPSATATATSTVPPTPTATATATATPTAPATATPTATATATATSTATPTATATPSCTPDYTFTSGTGTIVPGVDDTGNHCDDCATAISLPFSFTLYGVSYTSAMVGSNGILAFGTPNNGFSGSCLPVPTATSEAMPFYRDQRTDTVSGCTGCGIFTTTTGTAPNRVFRVEYRTTYFGETSSTPTLDYEVNLYESGTPVFDYTYGLINSTTTTGRITSIGVQRDATLFTQYACDTTGQNPPVATGQKLTAALAPCGTPTPTATPTTTASGTPTPTPTCGPAAWQSGPPQPPARYAIQGALGTDNMLYIAGGQTCRRDADRVRPSIAL